MLVVILQLCITQLVVSCSNGPYFAIHFLVPYVYVSIEKTRKLKWSLWTKRDEKGDCPFPEGAVMGTVTEAETFWYR